MPTHRYWLERRWLTGSGTMGFVMLNPSTADEARDDPTIRRCLRFAGREGCERLVVANIYSQRATDPRDLDGQEPLHEIEEDAWARLIRESSIVVAAWGQPPRHLPMLSVGERCLVFREMARDFGVEVHCLGTTKYGYPRHPLYVRKDALLVPFPWEAATE